MGMIRVGTDDASLHDINLYVESVLGIKKIDVNKYDTSKAYFNYAFGQIKEAAGYVSSTFLPINVFADGDPEQMVLTGRLSKVVMKVFGKTKGKEKVAPILKFKPCGCFTAGTQVYTENGYKSIEDIEIGDLVWAFDDNTENLELKKVTNTFIRGFNQVYKIHFDDEIIEATHEHPFFIGGKWLKVDQLKEGDLLKLYDGKTTAINKIEVVEGDYTVYNFTVEDFHTYYVSKSNILVHNGNPCEVIFKDNFASKIGSKANEIRKAAAKNGVVLPGKPKTTGLSAFKNYITKVVNDGVTTIGSWGNHGDVYWSKLGDTIVIRDSKQVFISILDTTTNKGIETLERYNRVIKNSTKTFD